MRFKIAETFFSPSRQFGLDLLERICKMPEKRIGPYFAKHDMSTLILNQSSPYQLFNLFVGVMHRHPFGRYTNESIYQLQWT